MKLTTLCPHCKLSISGVLSFPGPSFSCPRCQKEILSFATDSFLEGAKIDQCPVCGAAHLYRRKDFNQKWGIALVAIGVIFAYFTYGLSLLAVTALDFFLFRRVKEVGICYQCQAELRNSTLIESLEPFKLPIFDYYKNLPH